VHPAAELFRLMSSDETKNLVEDIKKHGLINQIAVWQFQSADSNGPDHDAPYLLLDGRNRLDAIEIILGRPVSVIRRPIPRSRYGHRWVLETTDNDGNTIVVTNGVLSPESNDAWYPGSDEEWGSDLDHLIAALDVDPLAYIVSSNLHRRHLTAEDKRVVIAGLLKIDPTKSNRAIANMLKYDHKMVGSVRKEQEQLGNIPQLPATIGEDGKARPARRASAPRFSPAVEEDAAAQVEGCEDETPAADFLDPQVITDALTVLVRAISECREETEIIVAELFRSNEISRASVSDLGHRLIEISDTRLAPTL
jgi:hypothetical protein